MSSATASPSGSCDTCNLGEAGGELGAGAEVGAGQLAVELRVHPAAGRLLLRDHVDDQPIDGTVRVDQHVAERIAGELAQAAVEEARAVAAQAEAELIRLRRVQPPDPASNASVRSATVVTKLPSGRSTSTDKLLNVASKLEPIGKAPVQSTASPMSTNPPERVKKLPASSSKLQSSSKMPYSPSKQQISSLPP